MTTETLGNTNDPQLGTAADGGLVCRKCGARYRMTDEELAVTDLRRGIAFTAAHGSRCNGSTSTPEPSEAHLKIMRNLARGIDLRDFVVQPNDLKAMIECVQRGWVSGGQLTNVGRALVATHALRRDLPRQEVREAVRTRVELRVVPDPACGGTNPEPQREPILLPPSSLHEGDDK